MSKFTLLTTLTLNAAGYSKGIDKSKKEAKQLARGVQNASKSVKQSFAGIGDSFTPILMNTNGLTTSIIGGVKAFRIMTKSVHGLKAALVSSGIGAIVVALGVAIGAMTTYMKRTDEGSNIMTKALNRADAVMDQTLHKVSFLGAALFDLFQGNWEGMKENLKKVFSNFHEEMKTAMANANTLSEMQIALEKKKDVYQKKRAQIEVQISDLKNKSKDENYTVEQRIKYNNQLKGQMKALYDLDYNMQNLQLQIAKQEMKLGEDNHEYRQKVNLAEAELIRLRATYNTQLKETIRNDNQLLDLHKTEVENLKIRKQFSKEIADLKPVESIGFEGTFSIKTDDNPLKKMGEEMQKIQAMKFAESQVTQFQKLGKVLSDNATKMQLFTSGVGAISNAFVDLSETGQSSFKELITVMLDGLRQILIGLLAKAIGGLIAGESQKGLLGLVTATVGISALMGLWKSRVPAFQDGGIVGGYSFTGDQMIARVNSGEMILNQNQQKNLFNLLNSGSNNISNGNVTFKIQGTELVGVLNNYNQRISRIR